MIGGNIEGHYIRMEIIEDDYKEDFEKRINKALNAGGTPLFESFSIGNYTNYRNEIKKNYHILIAFDDTGKSLKCK